MTTQHTPGPWTMDAHLPRHSAEITWRVLDRDSDNADVVAIADPNQICEDGGEANARLIAAAPDLLAALKSNRLMMHAWKAVRANMNLADDHGELNQTIAEMDAAIAKAEGRP